MIPLIKFSDIKKNPQELIIKEGHAAIVRYSDVVGFVVEPERMRQLINDELEINHLSKSLEEMLNEMHSNGRIDHDVYQELFGLL